MNRVARFDGVPRRALFRLRRLRGRFRSAARRSIDRFRRLLHGSPAPGPSDGSIALDELAIGLLFPEGLTSELRVLVTEVVERDGLTTSSARTILGMLDQRDAPSPVSIKAAMSDLAWGRVGGSQLALDRADRSVSVEIASSGTWEPHVTQALRRLLSPGDTFVDIGANVGYHTLLAASLVGCSGRVVAFEANGDNARLIAHSIEVNGLQQVDLRPLALSDATGFAWFRTAIGSNGGFTGQDAGATFDATSTIVPTLRLDDLDIQGIDVIKVDIEGAEPRALAGAASTIDRDQPVIIFEFSREMVREVAGVDGREFLAWFESIDYELMIINRTDGEFQPIGSIDDLLDSWQDPYRIEDFVAMPVSRRAGLTVL